nr:hypothetical protein [Tanacetum cinerariifolium]
MVVMRVTVVVAVVARRCCYGWISNDDGIDDGFGSDEDDGVVRVVGFYGSSTDACTMTISSMAFTVLTILQAIKATDDSPAVPEHTTVETPMNISLENKAHFLAGKEAIHLILTGIGDDIYSTVDACQIAQEM